MTFWTALIIAYTVPGMGTYETRIYYPSLGACSAAMDAFYGDHIYAHYEESAAVCVESNVLSASPRPRPRPQPAPQG